MDPNRWRRLRESPLSAELCNVSTSALAALLNIDESDAAVVRDPLAVPELRRKVEAQTTEAVTLLDEAYPPLLREIADPPFCFFARGDVALLRRPLFAVVGTRRPSPYGVNAARMFARELTRAGLVVTSGLARGIDAAAHDESLLAGGSTVAVLGTGLDVIYPREHKRLTERISENGCVVTEYPPGTQPRAMNFPTRNRIIAGLSVGTLVVEATDRSGSLITARLAAEQGRDVFAVPGSVFSRVSDGPHALIQSGAKLVRGASDILEELGWEVTPRCEIDARHSPLVALLSYEDPRHVDELSVRSGLPHNELAAMLLELELGGIVRSLPGARYVRSG